MPIEISGFTSARGIVGKGNLKELTEFHKAGKKCFVLVNDKVYPVFNFHPITDNNMSKDNIDFIKATLEKKYPGKVNAYTYSGLVNF